MSRVTVSMADVILSFRCWIFLIFSAYTVFLMCPTGKNQVERDLSCEVAQFVLWYAELKSVVAVQRKWRSLHPEEKPPTYKALNRWMNQFKETGTVEKQKSTGRPRTSEEMLNA